MTLHDPLEASLGLHKMALIIHHDNADIILFPSHSSTIVNETFEYLDISSLRHSPYSPDVAPSDFSWFQILQCELVKANIC